jgi:hypothetical protein
MFKALKRMIARWERRHALFLFNREAMKSEAFQLVASSAGYQNFFDFKDWKVTLRSRNSADVCINFHDTNPLRNENRIVEARVWFLKDGGCRVCITRDYRKKMDGSQFHCLTASRWLRYPADQVLWKPI